jgi:membrane protein YqaA with SNARE-associated domain
VHAALLGSDLLAGLVSGGFVPNGGPLVPGTVGLDWFWTALDASFGWLKGAVETARGWPGLGLIALYSFLIAFVLPLPSEVVLAPAGQMQLGLPMWAVIALIVVVSGVSKAVGSLFAFHIGQEAKKSGPVIRFLRESRFEVVSWSENTTVDLAKQYGYAGLALALSIPFFPDTISIYAFAVLEEDYYRFAAATFAGSVGRLLVTLGLAGGVLAVFP